MRTVQPERRCLPQRADAAEKELLWKTKWTPLEPLGAIDIGRETFHPPKESGKVLPLRALRALR